MPASPKAPVPGSNPLVLVGGGGHALVLADAAAAEGFEVVGFLDDDLDAALGRPPNKVIHVGKMEDLSRIADRGWIIAVGHLPFRQELIDLLTQMELGPGARTVVHPSAVISPSAQLGAGVFIGPRAVVNARAVIMDHAIVNSGAVVEHECIVGVNSHICPGAVLGGNVRVGSQTMVGLGSRVLPNLSVGDGCVIGAGAVVVRSAVDEQTVVGVPGKAATRVERTVRRRTSRSKRKEAR